MTEQNPSVKRVLESFVIFLLYVLTWIQMLSVVNTVFHQQAAVSFRKSLNPSVETSDSVIFFPPPDSLYITN